VKEPVGLMLEDNKRPLFFRGLKGNHWLDVTVPDTYAESVSHIADTVATPGAAAH